MSTQKFVTQALRNMDEGNDTIETDDGILILSFQHTKGLE